MLRVLRAEMSKWFLIHACSTRGISCIGLSHGCRTSCGGYTFSQSGNAEPPSPRLVAEISLIKQVLPMKNQNQRIAVLCRWNTIANARIQMAHAHA